MNSLVNIKSEVTMSSLDFLNNIINPSRVESGESPVRPSDFHARVNDEIEGDLNYENFVVGKTGHKTHYAMLTMDQMMLVGMRESKAVRRSVLSKLKVMHEPQIPQTLPEALRLAADLAEQKAELESKLVIAEPKAEVFDIIVERNGLYNASQVAQKVGQSAVWLNKQLESLNVYNRSVKRGRVFQQWFVDKGYGIMRETENGFSQAMFFAEGEMWIIKTLTENGLI